MPTTTVPPDGSAALRPRGDTTLYLTADGLSTEPPPPATAADPAEDANVVRADDAVEPTPLTPDEE